MTELLAVGGHTGLADLRHYVDEHRLLAGMEIVTHEVVDHPTENRLVALVRNRFVKYDQMDGIRLPT